MVAVLLAAAVVSALLGDLVDTVAIAAIVLLNALLASSRSTAPKRRWRRCRAWRPPW